MIVLFHSSSLLLTHSWIPPEQTFFILFHYSWKKPIQHMDCERCSKSTQRISSQVQSESAEEENNLYSFGTESVFQQNVLRQWTKTVLSTASHCSHNYQRYTSDHPLFCASFSMQSKANTVPVPHMSGINLATHSRISPKVRVWNYSVISMFAKLTLPVS